MAELPAEDGALDRALTELDTRLTTWLAAMDVALRAAQDHAVDVTPEQSPAAIADVSVEEVQDTSTEGQSADSAADVVADALEAAATPEPTLPDAPPAELDPTQDEALTMADVTQESSSTDLPSSDDGPSDVSAQSMTSEPTGTADDDDEQLLASLDEQTLAAIRVKRRLCGNRRSVRELLDEMSRPEPAEQVTKPQPKRWWRRRSS